MPAGQVTSASCLWVATVQDSNSHGIASGRLARPGHTLSVAVGSSPAPKRTPPTLSVPCSPCQALAAAHPGIDWNELSYAVMWRVAATQLACGLSLVVDCPLARRSLYDRAVTLAAEVGTVPFSGPGKSLGRNLGTARSGRGFDQLSVVLECSRTAPCLLPHPLLPAARRPAGFDRTGAARQRGVAAQSGGKRGSRRRDGQLPQAGQLGRHTSHRGAQRRQRGLERGAGGGRAAAAAATGQHCAWQRHGGAACRGAEHATALWHGLQFELIGPAEFAILKAVAQCNLRFKLLAVGTTAR